MKISNVRLEELRKIMQEEYKHKFVNDEDLEKFAYSLIGLYELNLKAKTKKFGNSPVRDIDIAYKNRDYKTRK